MRRDIPLPAPKPGEILIKTAFIGINRADLLQIEGKYAPPEGASPLPGLEVSGIIAKTSPGHPYFVPGTPVCALLSGGGYAEYVAVPLGQVIPLPEGVGLKEAACLPEAAATSLMALGLETNLQPGERVLIHGGTSGLGLLMTQIAKSWGADVYSTVGSAEKVAFLETRGIHAINHHDGPFGELVMAATAHQGIDVIVDTLGGPAVEAHFRLLKRGGRMVTLAAMAGTRAENFTMTRLLMNQLRWRGAMLRSRSAAEKAAIITEVRTRIWPHLTSGAITPVVDTVFPFAQAEKALARMQERLHMGKILLEVAP